jgi:hypothetical protein
MTFAKLKALALAMSPEDREATLKQLCNDPRFAAVVSLIWEEKEKASDDAALPTRAVHHGVLAHAAGSRYQLTELENRLRAHCTPEKVRRKAQAETEPED